MRQHDEGMLARQIRIDKHRVETVRKGHPPRDEEFALHVALRVRA